MNSIFSYSTKVKFTSFKYIEILLKGIVWFQIEMSIDVREIIDKIFPMIKVNSLISQFLQIESQP